MNQSDRIAVLPLDLAQKRYEQLCLFRRQFDIVQNHLGNLAGTQAFWRISDQRNDCLLKVAMLRKKHRLISP